MKPLELPVTIRTPSIDEVPYSDAVAERIQQRATAKIVEGYSFKENPTGDLPFKFYCEINIDNSRLWELFNALAFSFPEMMSVIFGEIDEDLNYGAYADKLDTLATLAQYETELVQDGHIQFGIISHDEQRLLEVFVERTKYIKYWGVDADTFSNIMQEFGLSKMDDLNFIDEFPLVTTSLRRYVADARPPDELIELLKKEFVK